jgi:hypothetical protein
MCLGISMQATAARARDQSRRRTQVWEAVGGDKGRLLKCSKPLVSPDEPRGHMTIHRHLQWHPDPTPYLVLALMKLGEENPSQLMHSVPASASTLPREPSTQHCEEAFVATRVQSHLLPPQESIVVMTSGLLVASMPLSCFVTHTECHTVSVQDMADAEEFMEKAGSLSTVHPGLISRSHFL